MKVKIIKCSKQEYWWRDKIGEVVEVKELHKLSALWFITSGIYSGRTILKLDCEIVSETKQPQGTWFESKVVGSIKQKSYDERSCESCKIKSVDIECCNCYGEETLPNWQPREAKEKPKKKKWVCTQCSNKCSLKKHIIGMNPSFCPCDSKQAKWKLKVVK